MQAASTKFDLVSRFLRPVATTTPLIRVGAFGDGGYLVPDDLHGIAACYSPGVSRQSTFELDLAEHGIPSFMADASCSGPVIDIPGGHFIPKFVGPTDGDDRISMASWVEQTDPAPAADLLLQMDIEGDEYSTIAAIPERLLKRFRIVIIELHRLPSIISKEPFFNRAKPAIEKLMAHYEAVHLHANNASGAVEVDGVHIPRVVEVTFLRKDRANVTGPVIGLPHPLDRRHRPDLPDLELPVAWLRQTPG